MSDIPRIKVVNEKESWLGTQYYINNRKIDKVKAVDFRVAVDEVPTFDFEMMGYPEVDMLGDVRFSFTPHTIEEAVKVLRNELLKHGDIYDAFTASVKSAMDDEIRRMNPEWPNIDMLTVAIMRRIIGEK